MAVDTVPVLDGQTELVKQYRAMHALHADVICPSYCKIYGTCFYQLDCSEC